MVVVIVPGVDVDEARLAEICDGYGIAGLKVFGSRVRGTERPGSDIDVLYTLRPGCRLGWEIDQLADELAAIFGRPCSQPTGNVAAGLARLGVAVRAR